MQVGKRGRWTYRDWIRWHFLWKFFPWYAREMRYRGDFCLGQGCMHWFWEDPDKKERGYCSVAISRTQNMMWARELEEREPPLPQRATRGPPCASCPGQRGPQNPIDRAGGDDAPRTKCKIRVLPNT